MQTCSLLKISIALKIKDINNFVLQDIDNFVLQRLINMCERSEHILTKTTLQVFYKEPIIEVVDKNPLILCFKRHY